MSELGTNDDLGTLAGLQRMAQEANELKLRRAAHLLDDALAVLKDRWRTSHLPDCPRRRDDYDCTCGLSDLCWRIEDWLGPGEACPRCGAFGWHQCEH